VRSQREHASAQTHCTLKLNWKRLPLALLICSFCAVSAQERKVDPTWRHRYVPGLADAAVDLSSPTCHYQAIFGEGDAESQPLPSVARFGEAAVSSHGSCAATQYDRQEEIYFVLAGSGVLQYSDRTYRIGADDFMYLPPGVKHSISNNSDDRFVVLVMGFKIRPSISLAEPSPAPKIVNLRDVKEETVEGHPSSVLYKLLLGPKSGKRDAIDDAYVVVSFFWMDFAPGGTNFPHHHETAEEIYLVLDGEGDMVAGGGVDGVEGRHSAKAGDAYYFRQNCTVGFYNQNKPGAKAHILAVRSWVPLPQDED
jgi:mannose-6-phosphate isomerase-like protein (cupin superfamily)